MTPRGRGWNAYMALRASMGGVDERGRVMPVWDDLPAYRRMSWTVYGLADKYLRAVKEEAA